MKPLHNFLRISITLLLGARAVHGGFVTKVGSVCTIHASPNMSDDAPAILQAFALCGKDASIIFDPSTFHIESVMNTTGLQNVHVDLPGTLLVSLEKFCWDEALRATV
jgi:galacturan 1,4-alpha-galacturonidase